MAFISIKPSWHLPDGAATPESVYLDRRSFLRSAGAAGLIAAGVACSPSSRSAASPNSRSAFAAVVEEDLLDFDLNPAYRDAGRPLSNEALVTSYNNFYEFGFQKHEPAMNARDFKLDPYTLTIEGLVDEPIKLDIDDIVKMGLEERVYRFRCVEAWAMTVPWVGVPLHKVLDAAGVTSDAKFVAFQSFYDPEQAPGQLNKTYDWPYHEALRIDEAMNDLAFVVIGLYGKHLLPQSGTPLRIVLPWKYGYKGPKSVVNIKLTAEQPTTFWNLANAREYKFYSNVDPEVPHPRWSQAKERFIGEAIKSRPTQWYNGYAEQVAHLYADMPRTLY
ncbi:MAG: protein-methionine-sulfoxide reductase catalytic subunit MsrP [Candidatus Hydrogenedentes bacterium]|nr:protein-methionine-sulfoxide reductase catalytic subunit MsrP [Candidatus Hydrogenedentota bacterium]